jgi:phosphoglycolate phosphatase-like HAD superfamily hydrolase
MRHRTVPELYTPWKDEFEYAGPQIEAKVDAVASIRSPAIAMVLDWDGVVTSKNAGPTTWHIMRDLMVDDRDMPSNGGQPMTAGQKRQKHSELLAYYGQLERAGTLTAAQASSWQRQAMPLLRGIHVPTLQEQIVARSVLRPGSKELFTTCAKAKIGVFIISTSLALAIEPIVNGYGLKTTGIFANRPPVSNDLIAAGRPQPFVHPRNKHRFHRASPHRAKIIVGDNLHDAQMVPLNARYPTVRARTDQGRDNFTLEGEDTSWARFVARSFASGYDMVAVREGLMGVVALTNEIVQRSA